MEENSKSNNLKALSIDDDKCSLFLTQAFLTELGFTVDSVDNVQDATEKLKKTTYDICFTDINLPVANGFQLTGFIRNKISKDLPVIAITASLPREKSYLCFEAGMNGFLEKPTTIEMMEEEIKRHLSLD